METSEISNNYIQNEESNNISTHKYNLYQQFLIIGIDPKIMFNINELDLKNIPEPLNLPKVISKYPNINLPYLNIPDTIVASHCFPQGIINTLVEYEKKDLEEKEKKIENFIFSLENMCPEMEISSLKINKVYYTCLLFYEDIEKYRQCINQRKYYKNSDINKNDNNIRNRGLLIPKVICLSSFTPFYEQTKDILQKLRNYADNFNYNNRTMEKINIYPIEKIIEGLIFALPALPRGCNSIILSNDSFLFESKSKDINLNNNKDSNKKDIIFSETPPNKEPRIMVNYSILLYYFKVEDIFEVIKFILLEEPIIFFCDDKEILTNVIISFISLIYPFQYPYPVVTILPEQNFSLISLLKHFIFGINIKYSDDYVHKKVALDGVKFIRIIRLDKRFNNIVNSKEVGNLKYSNISSLKADENKPLIKINEYSGNSFIIDKKESEDINIKKSINLPRHYFEKCARKLENEIADKMKEKLKTLNSKIIYTKKEKEKEKELKKEDIINNIIRDNILYFFTCILLKYQECCVKFEKKKYEDKDKDGNIVTKEFGERNIKLDEKYYRGNIKLNDIFNCKEFLNTIASLDMDFYNIFFKTKVFFNFIHKKIFPESNQDKLDVLYFDELINKKLSRESRMQKIEMKFLEYKYEDIINEININSLKRKISYNFNNYLQKHENRAKALNYFQFIYSKFDQDVDEYNIKGKKEQIYFYYYVFPILLNDGIFYNEKGENKKNIFCSEFFKECISSNRLYSQFENDSELIIEDDEINKQYRIYDYSLNPTSQFHMKNEYMIKMLWLRYFSKTFYLIPISKRKYYFELMNIFLKNNIDIIDERTILLLFNSINKYGDRNMNQDYFINLKNKTYISYLCLREKTKPENNFIRYLINEDNLKDDSNQNNSNQKAQDISNENQENNILEEKLMTFKVNYYCTGKKEELNLCQNSDSNLNTDSEENNICDEPFIEKISELYSDSDEYIQCKCNKCYKDQRLSITCEYIDEENNKFIIDFELLSPMALLKKDWFTNNSELDLSYISQEYLEYYLSAIFYFYEKNLPCEFLMPNFNEKNEKKLKEINNISYAHIDSEEHDYNNTIDKIIIIERAKKDKDKSNNNITFPNNYNEFTEKKIIKYNENENNIEKNLKSCFKGNKKHSKNVEFKLSINS